MNKIKLEDLVFDGKRSFHIRDTRYTVCLENTGWSFVSMNVRKSYRLFFIPVGREVFEGINHFTDTTLTRISVSTMSPLEIKNLIVECFNQYVDYVNSWEAEKIK